MPGLGGFPMGRALPAQPLVTGFGLLAPAGVGVFPALHGKGQFAVRVRRASSDWLTRCQVRFHARHHLTGRRDAVHGKVQVPWRPSSQGAVTPGHPPAQAPRRMPDPPTPRRTAAPAMGQARTPCGQLLGRRGFRKIRFRRDWAQPDLALERQEIRSSDGGQCRWLQRCGPRSSLPAAVKVPSGLSNYRSRYTALTRRARVSMTARSDPRSRTRAFSSASTGAAWSPRNP